jgi:hypothetical protein
VIVLLPATCHTLLLRLCNSLKAFCIYLLPLGLQACECTTDMLGCGVIAGGRGKSTVAKLLFNRLQKTASFLHSAFVEIHVGEGTDKTAQHLAVALRGLGATAKASDGTPVLSEKLRDFVRDRKVLLVLDNVWTASQLTARLPTQWGEGSAVIVTSRFESFADSPVWRKVCVYVHACISTLH